MSDELKDKIEDVLDKFFTDDPNREVAEEIVNRVVRPKLGAAEARAERLRAEVSHFHSTQAEADRIHSHSLRTMAWLHAEAVWQRDEQSKSRAWAVESSNATYRVAERYRRERDEARAELAALRTWVALDCVQHSGCIARVHRESCLTESDRPHVRDSDVDALRTAPPASEADPAATVVALHTEGRLGYMAPSDEWCDRGEPLPERVQQAAEIGDVIKCKQCGGQSRSISKGCSVCGHGTPSPAADTRRTDRVPQPGDAVLVTWLKEHRPRHVTGPVLSIVSQQSLFAGSDDVRDGKATVEVIRSASSPAADTTQED